MNATKSNEHNSLKVAPAKSYKNSTLDFIAIPKLLVLVMVIDYCLTRQGGNHGHCT
jgi:hypothetical protein